DKNVQAFVGTLNPITADNVQKFLSTDKEGKKLLGTLTDARVNDAVKAHDKKFRETELNDLIEAEYKKRHPDETEDQKELRTIKDKLEALEKKEKKLSQLKVAMK